MTGAVTGIYGYRRVSAVGRRVSATLRPGGTARTAGTVRTAGTAARRPAISPGRLAWEAFRFTRDVREGMELYRLRHPAPGLRPPSGPPPGSPPGLRPPTGPRPVPAGSSRTTDRKAQPEDGR
jgi:hypothetical protein